MSGPVDDISAPGIKAEGNLLISMRREVAQLLDRKNTNFPGAQPVSFARRHLEELTKQDYYVCEKSDGFRYLLYLTRDDNGDEIQYLIDRRNDYWFIPKGALHLPIPGKDPERFHIDTLIDGELVLDKEPDGGVQPKYLIFDCLVLDRQNLMNRPLDKRLAYLKERVYDPYAKLLAEFPEEKPFQHFIVQLKKMEFSYTVEYLFKQVLPGLAHGNDGLIFTCRSTEYQHGTDQHILKWKPANENSIDFRLSLEFPQILPDEIDIADGITEPYFDYDALPVCNLLVYAGDSREDPYPWYSSMFIDPETWESLKSLQQPLDDRIVECHMDDRGRWRFMRFRDDKENPNHTSTVESVIESIKDRVTDKDLIGASKTIRDEWKRRQAAQAQAS